jgi:hypothetical protein
MRTFVQLLLPKVLTCVLIEVHRVQKAESAFTATVYRHTLLPL